VLNGSVMSKLTPPSSTPSDESDLAGRNWDGSMGVITGDFPDGSAGPSR